MSKRAVWILATFAWLAALVAAALLLDRTVAQWVKLHPPFDKRLFLVWVVKLPGNFLFTLAIALLLLLFHPRRQSAAALLLLSAVLGGLFYTVIKWLVGRHRPVNGIEPFHLDELAGGLKGLFVPPPNLAFPSGHATLSFATAAALCILLPRWRWLFVLLAAVVCAERVLENAHYVSDVIAGAGLGVLAALVAEALVGRFGEKRHGLVKETP